MTTCDNGETETTSPLVITLDVETTTFEKGNPFSRRNKLCYIGIRRDSEYNDYSIEYSSSPYGQTYQRALRTIREANLIVGFNIKFDLHWIRRYEPSWLVCGRVWDCQLAEFILGCQSEPYPSLDVCCERRGLGNKLDYIRLNYWDKGIDTPDIPEDELREYLKQDVDLTYALYLQQKKEFEDGNPNRYTLFRAMCIDLLVLAEMEFNGLIYDTAESLKLGKETTNKIEEINVQLSEYVPDQRANFNSDDHLSCTLYGGTLYLPCRIKTFRTLKSGEIKEGEKWGTEAVVFPRLIEPQEGTETLPTSEWDDDELIEINNKRIQEGKKPFGRIYSVSEPTLKKFKAKGDAKKVIELILERSKLDKMASMYYNGIPALLEKKDWPPNRIHGQFNQCVAATSRLSSSGPNLQNFAGDMKQLFKTRFPSHAPD